MAKTAARVSKQITVVYFGSADNFDLPSDKEYDGLVKRLSELRDEDISALPLLIAGTKTVRIRSEKVVLDSSKKLEFKPTKDKRAPKVASEDQFISRASNQLEKALAGGKSRFVLIPYYIKVVQTVKE